MPRDLEISMHYPLGKINGDISHRSKLYLEVLSYPSSHMPKQLAAVEWYTARNRHVKKTEPLGNLNHTPIEEINSVKELCVVAPYGEFHRATIVRPEGPEF